MSRKPTHQGDDGFTGLLGEGRIPKHHLRIETLGTIDEASAALGLARSMSGSEEITGILKGIQRDLYAIMAEIAATPENVAKFSSLDKTRLDWLEDQLEKVMLRVGIPVDFVLPGDTLPAAALSLARTVVRRAERRVVELAEKEKIDGKIIIPYLNRLSLLCFYLELEGIQRDGREASLAKKK